MNGSDVTPSTEPWNVILGPVALRYLRSEMRGMQFRYQSRIEQQEPNGRWQKIALLDSEIRIDWSNYWPKEERTRIFFQDRCAAAIESQPEGRTLIIDGIGTWRFDETADTRLLGVAGDLPAIRMKTIPGVYWRGGPVAAIQDDVSGAEIARFREMVVERLKKETAFPFRILPARWRTALCTPPRLFQSFGPPSLFSHPAMTPLIAAAALRQCVIESLGRACAND